MIFEIFIPILDYYKIARRSEVLLSLGFPCAISFFVYYLGRGKYYFVDFASIISPIVGLLAILIGFSITAYAIFCSGSVERIKELKNVQIKRFIDGKQISLFQLQLCYFGYLMVGGFFVLIYNIILLVVQFDSSADMPLWLIVNFFLITHMIMMNAVGATSLYLVFWRH